MNNDLLTNLQVWHENDEYKNIIDAIEAIPESELDYNLKGQLARAYNNIDEYQKALDLLLETKDEGENDVNWHYRVGYAYFFLEKFAESKSQFERCLEFDADDEDVISFLRDCNDSLHFGSFLGLGKEKSSVPSFSKRCESFWSWFCENEEKLSDMVKNEQNYENEVIGDFVSKGTDLIYNDMSFNIGGDYEFNFTAEGQSHHFYLIPYLISKMPIVLKKKWNFSPFSIGTGGEDFDFQMYGIKTKISDIYVHIEFDDESKTFSVLYFNEQLNELDYDDNINAFCIMMDLACGEAISYMYIGEVDKAESLLETMFPLTELESKIKQFLSDKNISISEKPDENYCIYKCEAGNGGEFRMDTEVGTSCYQQLVADFYENETHNYDNLLDCGAFPLYIAISFWENRKSLPETGNEIIKIRHEIEDKIQSEILGERGSGNESGIVMGGAMGTKTFYIDLLLYDMESFEEKLEKLLEEDFDLSYYLFNFRRGHKI